MSDSRDEMRAAAMFEAECATSKGDLISRALHRRELAKMAATLKALADALEMLKHNRCPMLSDEREQVDAALRLAGRL